MHGLEDKKKYFVYVYLEQVVSIDVLGPSSTQRSRSRRAKIR